MVKCKICDSFSEVSFNDRILRKYDVTYFRCPNCGFMQTEDPYWLGEAYNEAITSLDIGLLSRNNYLLSFVKAIILAFLDGNKDFVDYGGGYGVLVRLMRDAGFNFYRQDVYCDNLFAKNFDISENNFFHKFELLTAFEVFEHLKDPCIELEKMLQYSDNILFSTELLPNNNVNSNNWWYFTPETGQHISLYTSTALKVLSSKFGMNLYSNEINLHFMTKKNINPILFSALAKHRVSKFYNFFYGKRNSLLSSDFNLILQKIRQQ